MGKRNAKKYRKQKRAAKSMRSQDRSGGSFLPDVSDEHDPTQVEDDSRLGRCYELCAQYVLFQNPEAILVHGTVQAEIAPPNPHAWVEYVDAASLEFVLSNGMRPEHAKTYALVIFDPVMDMHLPPEYYNDAMNTTEFERYTCDEMEQKLRETGDYGSWDERSQAAAVVFAKWEAERNAA